MIRIDVVKKHLQQKNSEPQFSKLYLVTYSTLFINYKKLIKDKPDYQIYNYRKPSFAHGILWCGWQMCHSPCLHNSLFFSEH